MLILSISETKAAKAIMKGIILKDLHNTKFTNN
jgi:hypothetical protein